MQGEIIDKENVVRPGRAWARSPHPRKGGVAAGGGGVEVRHKSPLVTLDTNSMQGKSGGDSLEWLKERVKQLKLNGKTQLTPGLETEHILKGNGHSGTHFLGSNSQVEQHQGRWKSHMLQKSPHSGSGTRSNLDNRLGRAYKCSPLLPEEKEVSRISPGKVRSVGVKIFDEFGPGDQQEDGNVNVIGAKVLAPLVLETEQPSKGNANAATHCQGSNPQAEQHHVRWKSHILQKSPHSAKITTRSILDNRSERAYKCGLPLPEEKELSRISPDKSCSAGIKILPEFDPRDRQDDGNVNVIGPKVLPPPLVSFTNGTVEHSAGRASENAVGAETFRREGAGKQEDCFSKDSAIQKLADRVGLLARTEVMVESTRWSSSSGLWGQANARRSVENLQGDSSRMSLDRTAEDPSPTLLVSELTESSSSGSSYTPSLFVGTSGKEQDTVRSHDRVPPIFSTEKCMSSESRMLVGVDKRFKFCGRASRVSRTEKDHSLSASRGETSQEVTSPQVVVPPTESHSSALMLKESDSKQLEYPGSDPRKRKAEQHPASADGDLSHHKEHVSSVLKTSQGEDVGFSSQTRWQRGAAASAMRSMLGPPVRPLPTAQKSAETALSHGPAEQGQGGMKLQIKNPTHSSFVTFARPSSSLPTELGVRPVPSDAVRTVSSDACQSRSTPSLSRNEVGTAQSTEYFTPGGDAKLLPDEELGAGAPSARMSSPASPAVSSVSRVASEKSAEITESLGVATGDVKDRGELRDMSLDGFPPEETNEHEPSPVVTELSSCLGSLSLEGNGVLKEACSRLPSQSVVKSSPVAPVAPVSLLTTTKPAQDGVELCTTSTSGRSLLTTGGSPQNQAQNLLSVPLAKSPRVGVVKNQGRSSPVVHEKRTGTPSNRVQADMRPVPVRRDENIRASTDHSCNGASTQNGNEQATVVSPKKRVSENLHFVWVTGKRYQKIGKIGKGGSSEVFKVIDGDCNIYALKKINLKGREHAAARGFYEEIAFLERLRGKRNVVQLVSHEVTNRAVIMEDYEDEKISEDCFIYMVLEFGEIDLAGILSKKRREMQENNELLDDNWLRFYWKHMLLAVKAIHEERVVHTDLKPANFLLVKGELKLIDFGIAKAIQNDTTHFVRDSQVGTMNYMSPEAFMINTLDEQGQMVKCSRASDIWSLGCILYQMVYGHTPFSQVSSFYAKIQAITSKNYQIEFPAIPDPWLLDVMKQCLTWDCHNRPEISLLLQHPFLHPERRQVAVV